jgi:hypothetical protein
MSRAALRIEIAKKDQKESEKMLSGGVQPVRAVLRAMALQQLAKGSPLHVSNRPTDTLAETRPTSMAPRLNRA